MKPHAAHSKWDKFDSFKRPTSWLVAFQHLNISITIITLLNLLIRLLSSEMMDLGGTKYLFGKLPIIRRSLIMVHRHKRANFFGIVEITIHFVMSEMKVKLKKGK